MIRVLLIPSSDYLGHPFPQRHNHLFERLHDSKEFEVHVIRFCFFDKPKLSTKTIIHELPMELKINKSLAAYYALNTPIFASEIHRIVKRETIDVVVMGNLAPAQAYLLIKQLTKDKVPIIFDMQDHYPSSATGYLANVMSFQGKILTTSFELIVKYIVKHSNIVTVPGFALKLYAKKLGARKIETVPNGIGDHFLKLYDGSMIRKKLGFNDNDIIVGYVGSVEFWLDMEPLIKAVGIAIRRGLPVKLLIIGKHLQTSYPEKVEEWLRKYNVNDATTWLNFVPYEEVPYHIAAMNIATIPFNSHHPTAYYAAPNKIWEYLSQKKLVLATPIPETIVNNEIIILVKKAKDYVKFFETIREVDLKDKIEKGYKKALNRTWNNSVKILASLIKDLMSRKISF